MLKALQRAEVQFDLLREIGHEGTNSKVFVAMDHQLNAELVIKQIPKASFSDVTEWFTESRVLYMSRHTNVVPIHYACVDADSVYVAMPHFPRGSVNLRLSRERLTVREIVRYVAQLASGVHNIHAKGLIHFDIKPDNVLLSDRDEALVADFGLAKRVDFNGVAGQDRFYLRMRPPEAFYTEQFTRAFDIYQIGLTMYRMTYGNDVFYRQFDAYGGSNAFDRHKFRHDVRNGQFPDRDIQEEHVPARLRNVINKCLATDPANRYSSVLHVVNDLNDIGSEELDWRPVATNDGTRLWRKINEDYECELAIQVDGASVAQRRAVDGGAFRRITEYCLPAVTIQQLRRFFRNH